VIMRACPGHDLAAIALHPTSCLCPGELVPGFKDPLLAAPQVSD